MSFVEHEPGLVIGEEHVVGLIQLVRLALLITANNGAHIEIQPLDAVR